MCCCARLSRGSQPSLVDCLLSLNVPLHFVLLLPSSLLPPLKLSSLMFHCSAASLPLSHTLTHSLSSLSLSFSFSLFLFLSLSFSLTPFLSLSLSLFLSLSLSHPFLLMPPLSLSLNSPSRVLSLPLPPSFLSLLFLSVDCSSFRMRKSPPCRSPPCQATPEG